MKLWLHVGFIMLFLSGCAGEREEYAVHEIKLDIDSMTGEQVSIFDIFSKVELVALDNEFPVGNIVFASVIYGGSKEYMLCHDLDTEQTCFFYRTEEGMRFLPGITDTEGRRMFKFIDFSYLPEFINRNILDDRSKAAYDKVLEEEGMAIAIYYL